MKITHLCPICHSVSEWQSFLSFSRCRTVKKKDMILNNYLPKLTGKCFVVLSELDVSQSIMFLICTADLILTVTLSFCS